MVEPLRCPLCDAPLRARPEDPWEIVRSLAAVHLRRCSKAPGDQREIGILAIRIADETATAKSSR